MKMQFSPSASPRESKTPIKFSMIRHAVWVAVVVCCSATVAEAAPIEYVYDASVSDWFGTDGWTRIIDDPGAPYSNPLFYTVGTNSITAANIYGTAAFSTGYIGAEWTAPTGEYITQIDFSFGGTIGWGGEPSLTIYAGGNSADTFVDAYVLADAWTASSGSESFLESQAYRSVAIRAWDFQNAACTLYAGSQAYVSSVTITTAAVPEPATLTLLLAGGIGCWLRRKK